MLSDMSRKLRPLPPLGSLDLPAILAALYDRAPDRVGSGLEVCHCPVCMTEETRQAIIATPVRALSADLIREYSNSAHGVPTDLDDLRALLPRYLELLAAGEAVDYNEVGCALQRFGDANAALPDLWDAQERALLALYARRVLAQAIAGHETAAPATGCPVEMAVILAVGGWPPADLTEALDAAMAAGGETARVNVLLDLCAHARDGWLDLWAIDERRPEARPAFDLWARACLTSEAVWELVTAPPAGLPPAIRQRLATAGPHLRNLIATLTA
jgi:hypothetical protein